ncbi:MAG: hypothetical protein ACREM3_30215 [Candidatus Rokuibacteriota bacterium]
MLTEALKPSWSSRVWSARSQEDRDSELNTVALTKAVKLIDRLETTAVYEWNKSFRETVTRLKAEFVRRQKAKVD